MTMGFSVAEIAYMFSESRKTCNALLFDSCRTMLVLERTDQPKKEALFSRFAAVHPLREIIFFAEKNKNHLFRSATRFFLL